MTTVYVVETGDYEQRHVFCVAATISDAVQYIRDTYDEPYVVHWEEPTSPSIGDCVELVGHFVTVPGYSTKHAARFSIVPEDVVGGDHPYPASDPEAWKP